jgi:hypothetical protein
MPRIGHPAAALAAAFVACAAPSLAQQPSPDQISAIRASCRSDFMANCSGVPRGGAEALACLKQHMAQLSASCQTAVSAIAPKTAPAAAAPPPAPAAAAAPPAAAPAASTAPTAAPPAGPKPSAASAPATPPESKPVSTPPLKKMQATAPPAAAPTAARAAAAPPAAPPVSPTSQPASLGPIPPLPPRARLAILRACGSEHQAYCANVPVGGGRIVDCLAANGASLSASCRQAILSAR